jgi:8-oxo-dGTP pyrophosphatase MutT (NUDIX family)
MMTDNYNLYNINNNLSNINNSLLNINNNSLLNNNNNSLSNTSCNNCGKIGHIFQNCKYPITSVGIIAFRKNKERKYEYLMIRRKDTIGFMEFIRGKYQLYNKSYIKNIMSEMTNLEKHKILTMDFHNLWNDIWNNNIEFQFRAEETSARDKFETLKNGYTSVDGKYNIVSLLNEINTNWEEQEWGFPKGRHNNHEKDIICALREFEEETGYNKSSFKIIQNIIPFEEIFTGSNYKSYKHKYFLAMFTGDDDVVVANKDINTFHNFEVSKMEWKNYEEALKSIRSYNLEKIEILQRVDKILNDYKINC